MRALLIAAPNAPGQSPLRQASNEVHRVAALMQQVGTVSEIVESPALQPVIDRLPAAHVVHLACHGVAHKEDAVLSHFALHDGRLSIETLAKLDLPNAVLAFLSACDTARGDEDQPEQAIHLAGSMLFCGFRSVIATMWSANLWRP
jgi:CHAT domain-containing protein